MQIRSRTNKFSKYISKMLKLKIILYLIDAPSKTAIKVQKVEKPVPVFTKFLISEELIKN